MASTESMCEVVCGAFHVDSNTYDRSARKSTYARTIEGDWRENRDYNFRHFGRRPFEAEEEEAEEEAETQS